MDAQALEGAVPSQELRFMVPSKGPLGDFTRERPHVVVQLWCDWTREVVEVVGATRADLEALRAVLAKSSRRVEELGADPGLHVFVVNCVDMPHDDVNQAVDQAGALNLPPTRIEGGQETFRILAFDEGRTRELFRHLREAGREAQVLAKTPLRVQPMMNTPAAGLTALVEPLTDRQLEALVAAQRHGLYESPRRTTPTAVAKSLGISRTTFEEHLRKAEAKLMLHAQPYLELHLRMRAYGPTPQHELPPGVPQEPRKPFALPPSQGRATG